VVLVDDGVATGSTMRAAIKALRQQKPAELVVAIPVAPPETVEALRKEADNVVCTRMPEPFLALGAWYASFPQTPDAEIQELLARANGN
jgi:putative phosphoribosyl transferase